MSDSRTTYVRCPACGGGLVEVEVNAGAEPALIEMCDSCQGVWLDWFDGHVATLLHHVKPMPLRAHGGRGDGMCPRDGTPLDGEPFMEDGPTVERCGTCMGIFVRRERIDALRAFDPELARRK